MFKFFPLHLSNTFSPFYKNTKNIFWVSKFFGKIFWTSFRAKFGRAPQGHLSYGHWDSWAKRRDPAGLAVGRPTPQVVCHPGGHWVGPCFSNGFIAIMPGLSAGARAIWSLYRGREGGVKLSCSLLHSLPPSHKLWSVSLDFSPSLVSRNLFLSFLCCKIVHTLGGTTFG